MYNGDGFSKGDGFVPFYLSECREKYPAPQPILSTNVTKEMKSVGFKVKVTLNKGPVVKNKLGFVLSGNDMPTGYEAVLNNKDYFSLGVDIRILNAVVPDDWTWIIKQAKDDSSLIKFEYHGNQVVLNKDVLIAGFWIELKNDDDCCSNIGWMTKSATNSGYFDGFGTIQMC